MSAMDVQPRPLTNNAAGLNNILNRDEPQSQAAAPQHLPQLRDSGFYSTAEASSKRTFFPIRPYPSAMVYPLAACEHGAIQSCHQQSILILIIIIIAIQA